MHHSRSLLLLATISVISLLATGCANFRKLGENLQFIDETVVISARITNASTHKNIQGITFDWDEKKGAIASVDVAEVQGLGIFGFFVKKSDNQYLCAYSDVSGDRKYQAGEPAWISNGPDGKPAPLDLTTQDGRRARGELSAQTIIPAKFIDTARAAIGDQSIDEVKSGWNIPVALGEVADLREPRFSAKTGANGYWEPAGYKIDSGIGIYFLEDYDPARIPVLFVYGAAGSPQDWTSFFKKFDRQRYQLWFYQYPSAERLEKSGEALNRGIQLLQSHYGFRELNVVAHSMGGLLSRHAVLSNYKAGNRYIKHFVTISSPFGGMEFAKSGVKHASAVVPSWHDMVPDSDLQKEIFKTKLRGRVPYMILYGTKAKRSLFLPAENDGTVSVESVTREEAMEDAVKVQSFDEDHVSILSNPQAIRIVEQFLSE